jgi:hypothetical protein
MFAYCSSWSPRDERLNACLLPLVGALARSQTLPRLVRGGPEVERLWIGLFHLYARAGDLLGLGTAERQLRQSLVELSPSSVNVNPGTVTLPAKLGQLVQEIRVRLSDPSTAQTSAEGFANKPAEQAKLVGGGIMDYRLCPLTRRWPVLRRRCSPRPKTRSRPEIAPAR